MLTAAPGALKAAAMMQGSGTAGLIIAQTAPEAEVLQYGATGVVSISFLYMMYALGAGKIVSRSTEKTEEALIELAKKATEREAEALKREASLIEMNGRLLDMVLAPLSPKS